MKKILAAAVLSVIVVCLQSCSDENNTSADNAGNKASGIAQAATVQPDAAAMLAALDSDADPASATYQTLDGRALELDLFAGKKVFINYWATWCAPCIREIPSIDRAAASLEGENYVFLFASDEPVDTIRDFLADHDFKGNFIKLNEYFGARGIDAVPSSALLDENGEVVKTWAGAYDWNSPDMLTELRK